MSEILLRFSIGEVVLGFETVYHLAEDSIIAAHPETERPILIVRNGTSIPLVALRRTGYEVTGRTGSIQGVKYFELEDSDG